MIIIGAGIIGLSCGWRLAQQGHKVTIFDSRETACEASWAGAGMLAPGGEVEDESPLAVMALSSLARYPGFVDELQTISDINIDYQRCGAIELAFTQAEAETLERRASRQSSVGIRSEVTTYPGSLGARFYPDDQLVAPRDVTAALRIACIRSGVSIYEHEPVREILNDGRGVRTAPGNSVRETYDEQGVLIAAGAWSSRLRSDLPVTVPVRGHLVAYHTGCPIIGSILRHSNTYLLQRRDGPLVAGSSTEHVGFNRAIDQGIVNEIHSRASKVLPALAALTPAESWNGFRPGIAGEVPAVGRLRDTRIWTAFGHYRNGILLAPETAWVIAESVSRAL